MRWCLFFLLFFVAACGQVKPPPSAGGVISEDISPSATVPFPHPETWKGADAHGMWVAQHSSEPCLKCHKISQDSDIPEVIPTCNNCHRNYPHPSDWLQTHRSVNSATCATQCHGTDFRGGMSGVSCYGCHTWPHPEGWRNFEAHGMFALSRQVREQECTPCHGIDYQGVGSAPSCRQSTCHASFPHLPGWRREAGQPQDHARFVWENTTNTCATSHCHGVDLIPEPGVTFGANCIECHRRNPHPPGWRNRENHGSLDTKTASNNYERCMTCHSSGRAGPAAARACFNCHNYGPHELLPEDQRTMWNTTGHAQITLDLSLRQRCGDNCHGTDFRGAGRAPSCFTCHTNFPHPSRSEWTQTITGMERLCRPCEEGDEGSCDDGGNFCWDAPATHISPHARQYLDRANLNATSRCETCHGQDLLGGNAERSCGDGACHAVVPQHFTDPNWRTAEGGTHGASYLAGPLGFASSCALCHLRLDTGHDGEARSCFSGCHTDNLYPHLRPPDVEEASDWQRRHGLSFIIAEMTDTESELSANNNPCRTCHGNDYRGEGNPAKDCAGCHEHFNRVSHQGCCDARGPWRNSAQHAAVFSSARNEGDTDRCVNCHGGDNVEPPFRSDLCTTCHRRRP